MVNFDPLISLLNRNPLLTKETKEQIARKYELSDEFGKKGLLTILQKSEEKLMSALIQGFKLKPAKDFLNAWKNFEKKMLKEVSNTVQVEDAKLAENNLLSQINSQ